MHMKQSVRPRKSHYVELLRSKRNQKRVPMRELAFEMDQRLFLLARARALFTRAMAQGLFLLKKGGGLARLGYRNIGDYAMERLGMSVRQAQQLAALAESLQKYPAIDQAWARGDLKYTVVRFLVSSVPPLEDELWSVAATRKTESQVRGLVATWEGMKARGDEGDGWHSYLKVVESEAAAAGRQAEGGDPAPGGPGLAPSSPGPAPSGGASAVRDAGGPTPSRDAAGRAAGRDCAEQAPARGTGEPTPSRDADGRAAGRDCATQAPARETGEPTPSRDAAMGVLLAGTAPSKLQRRGMASTPQDGTAPRSSGQESRLPPKTTMRGAGSSAASIPRSPPAGTWPWRLRAARQAPTWLRRPWWRPPWPSSWARKGARPWRARRSRPWRGGRWR